MSAVRLLSLKRMALKCLKLFASSSCNSIHVNLSFADAIDVNHDFVVVTAGLHSTCIGTVSQSVGKVFKNSEVQLLWRKEYSMCISVVIFKDHSSAATSFLPQRKADDCMQCAGQVF